MVCCSGPWAVLGKGTDLLGRIVGTTRKAVTIGLPTRLSVVGAVNSPTPEVRIGTDCCLLMQLVCMDIL